MLLLTVKKVEKGDNQFTFFIKRYFLVSDMFDFAGDGLFLAFIGVFLSETPGDFLVQWWVMPLNVGDTGNADVRSPVALPMVILSDRIEFLASEGEHMVLQPLDLLYVLGKGSQSLVKVGVHQSAEVGNGVGI